MSSVDVESARDSVSDDECDKVEISDDEDDLKSGPPGNFSQAYARSDPSSQPSVTPQMHRKLTTLSLRSLPLDCTGFTLAALMDRLGFAGQYDFVYAPIDFHDGTPLLYASVNMASHELAA